MEKMSKSQSFDYVNMHTNITNRRTLTKKRKKENIKEPKKDSLNLVNPDGKIYPISFNL